MVNLYNYNNNMKINIMLKNFSVLHAQMNVVLVLVIQTTHVNLVQVDLTCPILPVLQLVQVVNMVTLLNHYAWPVLKIV